jgi:hypothetical protein
MCYLKPLKVIKLRGKIAYLEKGIKAVYGKKIGVIKPNDSVLVFGNLIIEKINEKSN